MLQLGVGRTKIEEARVRDPGEGIELPREIAEGIDVVMKTASGELHEIPDQDIVSKTRKIVMDTEKRLIEAHAEESKKALELIGDASDGWQRSVEVVVERTSSSSSSSSSAQKDQAMMQVLKAQIEALSRTVKSERVEREKNTRGLLQLRAQFEKFDSTVREVAASIVQERSASIFQTATQEVRLQMERAYERTTIVKEVHTIQERTVHVKETTNNFAQIRQVLAMALKQERVKHSEETELMNRKILFLKNELQKQGRTDVALEGAIGGMKVVLKDLTTVSKRAQEERDANSQDIEGLMERVRRLEGSMDDNSDDLAQDIEKMRREILEAKTNVTVLNQRITAEKEHREREMVKIQQTVVTNGERITDLGDNLKETQVELKHLRELVTTVKEQQKESTEKLYVDLLKKVENKISITTNTFIQKQLEVNREATDSMVEDLSGSIKELKDKLDVEQKLREERDADVDTLKEQLGVLNEKIRSSSSKETITRLETLVLQTKEKVRIETFEREKSQREVESVKELVNTLVVRIEKENSHLKSVVKELKSHYEKLELRTKIIEKGLVKVEQLSKEALKSVKTLKSEITVVREQLSKQIEMREKSNVKLQEVVLTLDETNDRALENLRLIKDIQGSHKEHTDTLEGLKKQVAELRAAIQSMMPPCCRDKVAAST